MKKTIFILLNFKLLLSQIYMNSNEFKIRKGEGSNEYILPFITETTFSVYRSVSRVISTLLNNLGHPVNI